MKKTIAAVLLTLLAVATTSAFASTIKSWTAGNTLTATDLNSNFTHIHDGLRGGSHTLIVNADISGSAAISHSKLAIPALVPKAYGTIGDTNTPTACDGAGAAGTACASADLTNVASVQSAGTTGQYCVTLNYDPTDIYYTIMVGTNGVVDRNCTATDLSAGTAAACGTGTYHFHLICRSIAGSPAAANAVVTFIVFDNN